MVNINVCEWLLENADAPIRYRVARELLKNDKLAQKIEPELLNNATVKQWLNKLNPDNTLPIKLRSKIHGAPDYCLENTMHKAVQFGLHADMPIVTEAVQPFLDIVNAAPLIRPYRKHSLYLDMDIALISEMLTLGGVRDTKVLKIMLGSLDELYEFVKKGDCDIYLCGEERAKLKGVPPNYDGIEHFTKPELYDEYGVCWPVIHDIVGLNKIYGAHSSETDRKIDAVISFISTDDFHETIPDGYGILVTTGKTKYYSHGWDPKYPGWFDVAHYINNATNRGGTTTPPWSVPKLLNFAMYIAKYPIAINTKWYSDLLYYLNKHKTENGGYEFPKEWLREEHGYSVLGRHMSFGENRRKKNWCKIESTFYMQLLLQNV